jgi:hypothetical protein
MQKRAREIWREYVIKHCLINGFRLDAAKVALHLASAEGCEVNNKSTDEPSLGPELADLTGVTSSMPRYFFNTRIGNELILDPEGDELRDPDHAWNVARTTIREILKTEGGQAMLNATLEVTDDDGEIVLEFPFAEAILDGPEDSGTKH